jgi:hypothetical protein
MLRLTCTDCESSRQSLVTLATGQGFEQEFSSIAR